MVSNHIGDKGTARIRRTVSACVTWLLVVAGVAGAQQENGLFLDAVSPDLPLVASPASIRERFVTPRFELFDRTGTTDLVARQDTRLTVNLFVDLTVTAVLDAIDIQELGMVWSGHVDGRPGSLVTWSIVGDALAGEVRFAGALYEIRSAGDGIHVIREVDQTTFPPELEPLVPPIPNPGASARADPLPRGDDGSVVDVLVVWTPAAALAAGGTAAIQALIGLAVTNANNARANSGVTHTMNLVHMEEVAYTEATDQLGPPPKTGFLIDLERVTATADGFIDNVHTLRDTHGADLVAMISNGTGSCGIAWGMNQNSIAFAPFGFSVSRWSCIAGNLTLAHEWGHNQGLGHDTSVGLFSYSRGHNNSGICRTVMAVCCTGTRQQTFSNPATNFPAVPCTANPSGVLTISENARTLNETVAAVANFRQSVVCMPLVLANTTITGSQVFSGNPVTLGPTLVVNGTSIEIQAVTTVIFVNDIEIGGSFSAGTGFSCPAGPGPPTVSAAAPGQPPDTVGNVAILLDGLQTGGRLTVGESVTVQATASGQPDAVDFLANGALLATDRSPPFELLFTAPAGVGSVTFSVVVHDGAGNEVLSSPVMVPIDADLLATVRGRVVDAQGLPVAGAAVAILSEGLLAEYFDFEAPLEAIPDLVGRAPDRITRVTALNLRNPEGIFGVDPLGIPPIAPDYAARYTGWVRVPVTGTYRFFLGADEGARLSIAGVVIADIPGGQHRYQEVPATVDLQAGPVPIDVVFYESVGGAALQLSWAPPDMERQVIAPASLVPALRPFVTLTDANGFFSVADVPTALDEVRVQVTVVEPSRSAVTSATLRLTGGQVLDVGDLVIP